MQNATGVSSALSRLAVALVMRLELGEVSVFDDRRCGQSLRRVVDSARDTVVGPSGGLGAFRVAGSLCR